MTGTAILGKRFLALGNSKGHMGLMATGATFSPHGVGVGQMTILTGLYLTMIPVTGRTIQFCMDARICLQLFILFGMTGQTGFGDIAGKADFQGSMGIGVAFDAAVQGKMQSLLMTTAAGRNNFHISRGMPLVTIQAESLMRFPFALQAQENFLVAFGAIIGGNGGMHHNRIIRLHGQTLRLRQKKSCEEAKYG